MSFTHNQYTVPLLLFDFKRFEHLSLFQSKTVINLGYRSQQCIALRFFALSMRRESRHLSLPISATYLGWYQRQNPGGRQHEDIILWAAWGILDHCDATGICSGGKSCSVLNTRLLGKEKDIVWLLPCHDSLPPSSMFSHSLWWLVAHTVLRWLNRQSILICGGDTAPFDISPKNWLLWWVFLLSKGLLLFCPVHCVEKTPRQLSHCLSNISNPICCGRESHSIARPSAVAWTHAHTSCICTHSNV